MHRNKLLSMCPRFLQLTISQVDSVCCIATTSRIQADKSYKVLIVGGGTGGATMAAKLCSIIDKKRLAVIEPSDVHYYQPIWTLVGGGIKNFESSKRFMSNVLPKDITWIKDKVASFQPSQNTVLLKSGCEVKYEFLIVAMGLQLKFEKIKGLPEALETEGVCSNYSSLTVNKTFKATKNFKEGNAVFTQPQTAIKCGGAPQKIMYLTDDNFRKMGKRDKAKILFFTPLKTTFAVPKYAASLKRIAEYKDIQINYEHDLIEVKSSTKEAIFKKIGCKESDSNVSVKYEMLHVTPPMSAPDVLSKSPLADSSGFLNVDKYSLQHQAYPNVFGIGDCTNLPTSKTAAAVAAQCGVLSKNIRAAINGKPVFAKYNGYTSCPFVTGNRKGIIAEFDYNLEPLETFPIDQSKERYIFYFLKKDILPRIYWNLMLKGYWEGPSIFRKILRFGK